jgi:hypothetical protein
METRTIHPLQSGNQRLLSPQRMRFRFRLRIGVAERLAVESPDDFDLGAVPRHLDPKQRVPRGAGARHDISVGMSYVTPLP